MQVAHQVDDGVRIGRIGVVVLEEVPRAPGVVVVDRGQPWRVDQRHVLQRRRRPLHVEPADVPLGQVAQLDVEGAAVAAERQLALVAGRQRGGDAVADAVAVPADQPRALTGVGRGEPLADERVEQRRLARLDPSGDGNAHRPLQALDDAPRPRSVRRALDELLHLRGQLERPIGDGVVARPGAHRAPPSTTWAILVSAASCWSRAALRPACCSCVCLASACARCAADM